jgi:two-component system sensor histidine kinase KdpD
VRRALRGEAISGEKVELASTLAEPSRIVQVSAVPVRGDEGSVVAVVATLTDVTEARQSDAAREAFFGILSHEVKSPLAAVFGGVKVLELHGDGLEPGLRVELLRDVGSETERLYRLVENLLVLARVEARVPAFAAEPILLQHLVPRIVAHENARWPLAGFRVLTDPAPPTVVGEESGIEQALGNLLGNAAKYAGDQGPIEVCVTGEDDGVAVRVLDVGPGLAPDAGDRLFHLFYRSADARKAAPGAGIGLFVAARLVESMGGRIWARQREDRGAEFGFWLPQLRDEPDEEESQAAPAPGDVGPAAG